MPKLFKNRGEFSFMEVRTILITALLSLPILSLYVIAQTISTGATTSVSPVISYSMAVGASPNVLTDGSGNGFSGQLVNFAAQPYVSGPGSGGALNFGPSSSVHAFLGGSQKPPSFNYITFSTWFRSSASASPSAAVIATGQDKTGNSWSLSVTAQGVPALTISEAGHAQVIKGEAP